MLFNITALSVTEERVKGPPKATPFLPELACLMAGKEGRAGGSRAAPSFLQNIMPTVKGGDLDI